MRDYVLFTDGHKEEIVHYYITQNPTTVKFITPTGIYMYEQNNEEPDMELGKVIASKVRTHNFYKYDKHDAEFWSICRRQLRANWRMVNNIESINFVRPNDYLPPN